MATLTAVLPTFVAMGVKALREQVVLPRIVNRDYQASFGAGKGSTINVAIPSAIAVAAVSAAATPPATAAIVPTSVPVTLDQWYEAPFELSDMDLTRVDRGLLPMQASEAIKALANNIDAYLFAKYVYIYGYGGTAGVTPFATDLSAYLDARRIMNKQLAPMDPRYCVIDVDAEANALGLRAFQDASFRGDQAGIVNGQIGTKLGALWAMSQNVPTHTSGTGSGYVAGVGGGVLGAKTCVVKGGALGTFVVGDVVVFGSHTQQYVITGSTGAGTVTAIAFEPALKATVLENATITIKASHKVNLLLHRDCIAFATAPLQDANIAPNLVAMESIVDDQSGLALRLEVTREHKRWRWSFDVLYGAAVPRPELGVRLAG